MSKRSEITQYEGKRKERNGFQKVRQSKKKQVFCVQWNATMKWLKRGKSKSIAKAKKKKKSNYMKSTNYVFSSFCFMLGIFPMESALETECQVTKMGLKKDSYFSYQVLFWTLKQLFFCFVFSSLFPLFWNFGTQFLFYSSHNLLAGK